MCLALSKHFHSIDQPICLAQRLRIRRNKGLTSRRLGRTLTLRPRLAGPIAAQGGIEDDLHILEMRIDITVASIARHGGAPRTRIWRRSRVLQVSRDGTAGPEPDGDCLRRDLGRDNATSLRVEGGAEALGRWVADPTTHVLALGRVVDVAVWGIEMACEARGLDAASRVRVQRHAIVRLIVHAFDDVDLAVDGPCGAAAEQPEGGPDATTRGHVREVDDEEALVIGLLAV